MGEELNEGIPFFTSVENSWPARMNILSNFQYSKFKNSSNLKSRLKLINTYKATNILRGMQEPRGGKTRLIREVHVSTDIEL